MKALSHPSWLWTLLLYLPLQAAWATSPFASLFDEKESGFLPVEQAFVASASLRDENTVQLRFDIAEGYYLYRHQLRFSLSEPAGFTLGEPRLPDGKKKTDEYFGEIEAYYQRLDILIPIAARAQDSTGKPLMLEVRYQGCAERGLCYPPETARLPLLLSSASIPESTPAASQSSDQGQVAQLIEERSLWLVGLTFFGFGLLLALTPCMLPMLPILSGIIAGAGEKVSPLRGLSLAAAYVLAMALAYTAFGVVAGLSGANLQAAMQDPWVVVGFSAVFVVLALSMFDLFHLQLPAAVQGWLANHSNRQQGGSLAGAAIMGFLSALIVGPCLAPPLAGALLYISNTGDALLGGWALFALGIGMGMPLLALGFAEGGLLPRAGHWMSEVKRLFGLIMLGVAIWMLSRILSDQIVALLWALLASAIAGYLLVTARRTQPVWRYGLALLAALYALCLLWGAFQGTADPLRPWRAFESRAAQLDARIPFLPVKTRAELDLLLAEAARQKRPAVLDFYADWCVACVTMEHSVFGDPHVRDSLEGMLLLRTDVTANDEQDRELLKTLGVYGPPTLLFFGPDGQERAELRLVGETDSAGFIEHVIQLRR